MHPTLAQLFACRRHLGVVLSLAVAGCLTIGFTLPVAGLLVVVAGLGLAVHVGSDGGIAWNVGANCRGKTPLVVLPVAVRLLLRWRWARKVSGAARCG